MAENGYSQLCAYARKWLPGEPLTVDTLATATLLEREHWKNFEAAVTNGIGKAWKK